MSMMSGTTRLSPSGSQLLMDDEVSQEIPEQRLSTSPDAAPSSTGEDDDRSVEQPYKRVRLMEPGAEGVAGTGGLVRTDRRTHSSSPALVPDSVEGEGAGIVPEEHNLSSGDDPEDALGTYDAGVAAASAGAGPSSEAQHRNAGPAVDNDQRRPRLDSYFGGMSALSPFILPMNPPPAVPNQDNGNGFVGTPSYVSTPIGAATPNVLSWLFARGQDASPLHLDRLSPFVVASSGFSAYADTAAAGLTSGMTSPPHIHPFSWPETPVVAPINNLSGLEDMALLMADNCNILPERSPPMRSHSAQSAPDPLLSGDKLNLPPPLPLLSATASSASDSFPVRKASFCSTNSSRMPKTILEREEKHSHLAPPTKLDVVTTPVNGFMPTGGMFGATCRVDKMHQSIGLPSGESTGEISYGREAMGEIRRTESDLSLPPAPCAANGVSVNGYAAWEAPALAPRVGPEYQIEGIWGPYLSGPRTHHEGPRKPPMLLWQGAPVKKSKPKGEFEQPEEQDEEEEREEEQSEGELPGEEHSEPTIVPLSLKEAGDVGLEGEWSDEERGAFIDAVWAFRKDFSRICKECVPSKTVKQIIAFFYREWKRHPGYHQWKKASLMGRRVRRHYRNGSYIDGTVRSHMVVDGEMAVRILYDDGTTEDMFTYELQSILMHPKTQTHGDALSPNVRSSEAPGPHTVCCTSSPLVSASASAGGEPHDDLSPCQEGPSTCTE